MIELLIQKNKVPRNKIYKINVLVHAQSVRQPN